MDTQTTAQKPTQRRTRNISIVIRATQDEKDFIMKKFKKSRSGIFNTYALMMLVVGEVKNVDLTHYRELAKEVSRIGTNINQIVKFTNANGNIYPQEIAELQERMDEIWRLLKSSLSEQR